MHTRPHLVPSELNQPYNTGRYQSAIGSLLHLTLGTRPDIAYAVNKLAQFASAPQDIHWNAIEKIFSYIAGSVEMGIILGKDPTQKHIVGYFDASYADDEVDHYSTCGYVFLFLESPISWRSKKQNMVALSSTEAEYVAATEAAKESQWIASFAKGIPYDLEMPTQMFGNNHGANALTSNPTYHARIKHIDIWYRYVMELVEHGLIKVFYCNTKDMVADILTKALPKEQFRKLRDLICVINCAVTKGNVKAKKRAGKSSAPFTCGNGKCNQLFPSRNELFAHLKASGHFAPGMSYLNLKLSLLVT